MLANFPFPLHLKLQRYAEEPDVADYGAYYKKAV